MIDDTHSTASAIVHDAPGVSQSAPECLMEPLSHQPLSTEAEFFHGYAWTLNSYPTMADVVAHLRSEIERIDSVPSGWQLAEVATNVFLLACALSNAVADHLMGKGYDFSRVAAFPPARPAVRLTEYALKIWRRARELRLSWLHDWWRTWDDAVDKYAEALVLPGSLDQQRLSHHGRRLPSMLTVRLPRDLLKSTLRNPAFFHVRDLTHIDILALGSKFVAKFPARQTPILIAGIRTAGSYLAPVLRAYLKNQGYLSVDVVTLRPKNSPSVWERSRIAHAARRGSLGVIIDEVVFTGGTLLKVTEVLERSGFLPHNIVTLFPAHPTTRDWKTAPEYFALSKRGIVSLEPEEWHKYVFLHSAAVQEVLMEYFQARGYVSAAVVSSKRAEDLNAQLEGDSEEKSHTRLKRIYEVRVRDGADRGETRFVLAKSVGWGWPAYRAFFASQRLSAYLPPVLGLRNGILFTEWRLPEDSAPWEARDPVVNTLASYVAARVRLLSVGTDPSAQLNRDGQHEGSEALAGLLSGAYGWKPAAYLKRPRIRSELTRSPCPRPTLIDGKMRRREWIGGAPSLLKTDFEHHGMGKRELNVVDPAYDLADAILHFALPPDEEKLLIARYAEECGDTIAEQRLLLNKILAAARLRTLAVINLREPARLYKRAREFNRWYTSAQDFLTVHTMRFCAGLCDRPEIPRWRSPLVVLDLDGVLDRQVFSFPSTTAAGIQAVSLLHAHGFSIAVDSARSVSQVKEYCRAYGFAGGVAEYGSCIWDAVSGEERVVASPESLRQLEQLRNALHEIPGVFLDDGYQYSLRAYTHQRGSTAPLPRLLIQNLMSGLKMNHLKYHHTELDTAILAGEVDKGTGLTALLTSIGGREFEILAIGDSEPDLPMFAAATRSFAPSQISCRHIAKSLGCRIADRPYQPGLLKIVRSIIHPDGRRCERCQSCTKLRTKPGDSIVRLLKVADQSQWVHALTAALDPTAIKAFEI